MTKKIRLELYSKIKKDVKIRCWFFWSWHWHNIELSESKKIGAKIIEKHVTLNKKMLGPDHAASLEFDTFKELVDLCRKVSISLGSDKKKFLKSEKILHGILIRKFIVK